MEETLGELCEVPKCLLWRGLRPHCPLYNVSCIFFNKCLFSLVHGWTLSGQTSCNLSDFYLHHKLFSSYNDSTLRRMFFQPTLYFGHFSMRTHSCTSLFFKLHDIFLYGHTIIHSETGFVSFILQMRRYASDRLCHLSKVTQLVSDRAQASSRPSWLWSPRSHFKHAVFILHVSIN